MISKQKSSFLNICKGLKGIKKISEDFWENFEPSKKINFRKKSKKISKHCKFFPEISKNELEDFKANFFNFLRFQKVSMKNSNHCKRYLEVSKQF